MDGRRALFFAKQMEAYQALTDAVLKFDLLEGSSMDLVCDQILGVFKAFRRGYSYFDDAIVQIFDERITQPWKNGELKSAIVRGDAQLLYEEMLCRLTGEVLPLVRTFFKTRFPDAFSSVEETKMSRGREEI